MTRAAPCRFLDAVCFDLDGVLIDSEHAWDAARRGVVAETGGRWRPEATRVMMGMSSSEWSRYLADELEVPLPPEEINDRVVARLLEGYACELPLLPGAAEAVKRLARTWTLGLASSSNRPVIDFVLERSGLTSLFAVTVSGDEVAHGKPAPDVYLAAAAKLDLPPGGIAAVEDSSNGLRAAGAAGMILVAIPNAEFPPDADALALADLILTSLDELTPDAITALPTPRADAHA